MDLVSNNNIDITKNEADFQIAFDNYWHTDTTKHNEAYYKKQYDIMWMCVFYACANLCKKIYRERNVIVDDLDEVITDAAEYTMRFITGKNKGRKLYRPQNLGTFCYLRCRYIIDSPIRQWEDENILLWAVNEKGNYVDIVEGEYSHA